MPTNAVHCGETKKQGHKQLQQVLVDVATVSLRCATWVHVPKLSNSAHAHAHKHTTPAPAVELHRRFMMH